jgi:hypothetical protein
MHEVAERARRQGKPNCYYWSAVWWRLHAKESANNAECRRYSENQRRLFFDMMNRPEHYTSRQRPESDTDWQWSSIGVAKDA